MNIDLNYDPALLDPTPFGAIPPHANAADIRRWLQEKREMAISQGHYGAPEPGFSQGSTGLPQNGVTLNSHIRDSDMWNEFLPSGIPLDVNYIAPLSLQQLEFVSDDDESLDDVLIHPDDLALRYFNMGD